jgi:hypothetical protein
MQEGHDHPWGAYTVQLVDVWLIWEIFSQYGFAEIATKIGVIFRLQMAIKGAFHGTGPTMGQ